MQFDVLGPLRVVGAQGARVAMTSAAQRRLTCILVSRAGVVVSADSLAEHLDLSPGALRTSVSRLRRIVGFDVLVTAPPGYELRSDDVDARRFEQLLDAARAAADPMAARTALVDALGLWRGEAYGEFAHETWARGEADSSHRAPVGCDRGSRRAPARGRRVECGDRDRPPLDRARAVP